MKGEVTSDLDEIIVDTFLFPEVFETALHVQIRLSPGSDVVEEIKANNSNKRLADAWDIEVFIDGKNTDIATATGRLVEVIQSRLGTSLDDLIESMLTGANMENMDWTTEVELASNEAGDGNEIKRFQNNHINLKLEDKNLSLIHI